MKRLLFAASLLLAAACLFVWGSPTRFWDGRGPWVYYPFGSDARGTGFGISAWILAGAWFIALGTWAGLLSWMRVSRAWFAIALVGIPLFMYGTLFAFLESFWNFQTPCGPLGACPIAAHPIFLPLGLAVGMAAALAAVIGTRTLLDRFDRTHVNHGVTTT